MIHVELHHRHDAAEIRDEAAEYAGLIHATQRRFRVLLRAQKLEKDAVGLGVVAQAIVDKAQRAAQQTHGVGVKEGVDLLRGRKKSDQVDGIALEEVLVRDIEAAIVNAEVAGGA